MVLGDFSQHHFFALAGNDDASKADTSTPVFDKERSASLA
jgi:hypothetical protein